MPLPFPVKPPSVCIQFPQYKPWHALPRQAKSHIYDEGSIPNRNAEQKSISAVVGLAAVTAAENVGAAASLTPTMTGRTAPYRFQLPSEDAHLCGNHFGRIPTLFAAELGRYAAFWAKLLVTPRTFLSKLAASLCKKNFVNKGDICVFTLGDRTTSPRISQTGDAVSFDPTAPSPRPTNVMQIVQIGVEAEGDN